MRVRVRVSCALPSSVLYPRPLQWLAKPAPSDGPDLRKGGKYHLKETEQKLAKQTKALKFAITAATAKVRIAAAVKRRRARKEKAGIEQSPVPTVKTNPFVRQDTAKRMAEGRGRGSKRAGTTSLLLLAALGAAGAGAFGYLASTGAFDPPPPPPPPPKLFGLF